MAALAATCHEHDGDAGPPPDLANPSDEFGTGHGKLDRTLLYDECKEAGALRAYGIIIDGATAGAVACDSKTATLDGWEYCYVEPSGEDG